MAMAGVSSSGLMCATTASLDGPSVARDSDFPIHSFMQRRLSSPCQTGFCQSAQFNIPSRRRLAGRKNGAALTAAGAVRNSTGARLSDATGANSCSKNEGDRTLGMVQRRSRRFALVSLLAAMSATQRASATEDEHRPFSVQNGTSPDQSLSELMDPEWQADKFPMFDIMNIISDKRSLIGGEMVALVAAFPLLMKFWDHSYPELAYEAVGSSQKEYLDEEENKGSYFLMSSGPDMKEQIKEMKAAEQRWQQQVRDGRIKSLSAREAGYAIQLADSILLDVRPSFERNKSWVKNSIWVPVFEVDRGMDLGTLMKKASAFLMGGWWEGTALMKRNERFMADVVGKIPKDAKVIVSCQKGLRSLAACEQLLKVGYKNVSWVNGGYDAAEEGDFEREGTDPLKFSGIGGMSQFLGWTDVQRAQAAKEGIGYRIMLFGRLAFVVAMADVLLVAAQKINEVMRNQ